MPYPCSGGFNQLCVFYSRRKRENKQGKLPETIVKSCPTSSSHVPTITHIPLPSVSVAKGNDYTKLVKDRPMVKYTQIYNEPKSDTKYDEAIVYPVADPGFDLRGA